MDCLHEWNRLYKEVMRKPRITMKGVEAVQEFCWYVLDTLPTVRKWCYTYLSEHRKEMWVRYKLKRRNDSEWITVMKNWINPKFDVTYASLPSFEQCRELDILAIHEGKPCHSNGWYCWLCQDMEDQWEKRCRESSNNVFLNPSLQEAFVLAFLESPIEVDDTWRPASVGPRQPILERQGGTPFQYLQDVYDVAGGWWCGYRDDEMGLCLTFLEYEAGFEEALREALQRVRTAEALLM